MTSAETLIYTVGHSNHTLEHFLDLLKGHGVNAIADVRSSPYSRYSSQFNRESLKASLRTAGISYVFLGQELGARSSDPKCYENGRVQYPCLARSEHFRKGLDRVITGAKSHCIALLCAEKDPLTCHRTILVARELQRRGTKVDHILENGSVESHDQAMYRLLAMFGLQEEELFRTFEDRVNEAYRLQEERIAYTNPEMAEA